MVYTRNPRTRGRRKAIEFRACLVYIVSFKVEKALVSKQNVKYIFVVLEIKHTVLYIHARQVLYH